MNSATELNLVPVAEGGEEVSEAGDAEEDAHQVEGGGRQAEVADQMKNNHSLNNQIKHLFITWHLTWSELPCGWDPGRAC